MTGVVTSFDSSGNLRWVQTFVSDNRDYTRSTGVCADNAGNVFVSGYYMENCDLGNLSLHNTDTNYAWLFVAKLSLAAGIASVVTIPADITVFPNPA